MNEGEKYKNRWEDFVDNLSLSLDLKNKEDLQFIFIGNSDFPLEDVCSGLNDNQVTVNVLENFQPDMLTTALNVLSSNGVLVCDLRGVVVSKATLLDRMNLLRNEISRDFSGAIVFVCNDDEYSDLLSFVPDIYSVRVTISI